jgi:ADP-heptose:LPS heptosyltransferase
MTAEGWADPPRYRGSYTLERHSDAAADLAVYDFGAAASAPRHRILVLKLDHLGDFLIGLPAFEQLRRAFPEAHITLVCGSWNERVARETRLADEVLCYDFFPENSGKWRGEPNQGVDRFREICPGRFDIAIDLRVDDDTRFLLQQVEASIRCGIGSRWRHPYLDILLPNQFERRESDGSIFLDPGRFRSRMMVRTPLYHETDFSGVRGHLIHGPYIALPAGRFRVCFGLRLFSPTRVYPGFRVIVDVCRGKRAEILASQRVNWWRTGLSAPAALEFTTAEPAIGYEFRVHSRGHPLLTRMQFFGVRIMPLDKLPPRYRHSELHVGEELSLLVQLVAERAFPFRTNRLFGDRIAPAAADFVQLTGLPEDATRIAIAPLSNRELRDWDIANYARLVRLLIDRIQCGIALLGSAAQRPELERIVEANAGDRAIVNLAGRTDWLQSAAVVRAADLVICNNSGIAHLAAVLGTPTLAIYSGVFQPEEWGPRGEHSRAVAALVPCSPCGYDRQEQCPHDYRCMRLIRPEFVAEQAIAMLASAKSRAQ